jgi:predicted permease
LRRLGAEREPIEADLQELFEIRAAERGRTYAAWRHLVDALSLWRHQRHPDVVARPYSRRVGDSMWQDVVFAVRLFQRQPWVFGITIAGLALAIGMSTAVFTLVNATALRGSGITASENVYEVAYGGVWPTSLSTTPTQGDWAYSDFVDLQAASNTLEVVAAMRTSVELRGGPQTFGLAVSGNYFPVLNSRAHIGRTLTSADDQPGAPPLVVVSHAFWRNRLGEDPGLVGRTIEIDGVPFGVVGIAARRFVATGRGDMPPAFWISFESVQQLVAFRRERGALARRQRVRELKSQANLTSAERQTLTTMEAELLRPDQPWNPPVGVLGRTRAGVTSARASDEVQAYVTALSAGRGTTGTPPRSTSLRAVDQITAERLAIIALVLGGVGLTVLLAAANLANVLLATAVNRAREIGTRLALGATRWRLARQLLTESLLLGCSAGVVALLVAFPLASVFVRLVALPPTIDSSPDRSVYAFLAALSTAVAVLAGLAPTRYARRGNLVSALKTDRLGGPKTMHPGRLRWILVGGQAAISIVLLVVAALLTRSAVQVSTLNLGFEPEKLLSVYVGHGRSYDAARRQAYWEAALSRLRSMPGVTGVSLASMPPFNGGAVGSTRGFYLARNHTSHEYFDTIGAQVLRGRVYTADEVGASAPVAVITASLARRFWGSESPIGASLERVWGPEDPADGPPRGLLRQPRGTRVIGVVSDTVSIMRNHEALAVYLPLDASDVAQLTIATAHDASLLVRPITDVLRSLDADPGISIRPTLASERLHEELRLPRLLAVSATIIGLTALWLAIVGLFGVMSFVIHQRRQEVSIRMALGATREAILRMLLRQGLRPVVIGLAVGSLLALLAAQLFRRVLYGISPNDPLAAVAAVGLLLVASVTAVLIPARRAARTNPADLLREG